MTNNVGINLVEIDGRAAPSIQGAETSVAGFIVRSPRGPHGVVRQVTSFAQFTSQFGGYLEGAYSAYALKGFFDNGGGVAYVTRAVVLPDFGDATDLAAAKANVASAVLKTGTNTVLTVSAGARSNVEAGPWGNDLRVSTKQGTGASETFTLTVERRTTKSDGTDTWVPAETWPGLKIGGTGPANPARINDNLTGSSYIVVSVASGATANPDDTSSPQQLVNGRNEDPKNATVAAAVLAAVKARIPDFTAYDIQLLCSAESAAADFASAAMTYCDGRGDCTFVGHVPANLAGVGTMGPIDPTTLTGNIKSFTDPALVASKRYGALYFPWILVDDPLGNQRWVPPTGHVLGVYARTDRERGIWKAPAGNQALVRGALNVSAVIDDTQHTTLVTQARVNAIRPIPGQGIVIDSSRTLSSSSLWLYVGVRLFFNFIKTSLKYGLRYVVQEPNDESLWNRVKHTTVTPFLLGLWRRGAFGPGAPEEVFAVKVDADNNTPDDIKNGRLNIEVYLYPSRPAETIVITVGQQDGLSSASES